MPELSRTPGSDGAAPRAGTPRTEQPRGRGFWVMRDLPTLVWMILLVTVTIAHRFIPSAGWLMLHLLFLGAITHAILVWSQHFSYALTRSRQSAADRRSQNIRLMVANGGIALVLIGVPTTVWALTVVGATLVAGAVLWHGLTIVRRMRGALPGRFTRTLRYYIASAAFLPIGAALGAWLAAPGARPGGLILAHAFTNVLGWLGLTVAGTVVTLWPTMLRTKAAETAAPQAARALPVLAAAVALSALGAALEILPLIALGVTGYTVGLAIIGVALARAARNAPPKSFATLSVGAALMWWFVMLIIVLVTTIRAWVTAMTSAGGSATGSLGGVDAASGIQAVSGIISWAAPYLAAGFAAQVLVGALSYLVPVTLGGGPSPVRAGTTAFDRGSTLRVATANAALVVCALPVTSVMRVAASILYLIAIASFLPIFFIALKKQRIAKAEIAAASPPAPGAPRPRGPLAPEGAQPVGRRSGQALLGLTAVVLVTALAGAADPHAFATLAAGSGSATVAGGGPGSEQTAPTKTVTVEAADMRFTPDRVEVPRGTRLVIELTNTDETQPHDLVFANGTGGKRLNPGESTTIDVGVITDDVEGWCSIIGHRQMGMTFDVVATGDPVGPANDVANGTADGMHEGMHDRTGSGEGAAALVDHAGTFGDDFEPFDAVLPPLPPPPADGGPTHHEIELPVSELELPVAPGTEDAGEPVTQQLWTFGGTAPGPVLHGRVGDTFTITLINDGTIGHSIDFHAGALAPDKPMRTIAPGEKLTYEFTATRSGIWMYHCSTMQMSAHIANGMFGAVVIEPDDLPEVDESYVLVQSDLYLGEPGEEVDYAKLEAEQPDLVAFNGVANQYDAAPLTAKAGERVRVWLLDAGPNRPSSFHVIGGQFDTVWSEGQFLVNRATDTGAQALAMQPAQGGYVELVFPEAGNYPFVSHIMVDAERGAHGVFRIR